MVPERHGEHLALPTTFDRQIGRIVTPLDLPTCQGTAPMLEP